MTADVLLVFVKRPRAGEVKTRLSAALGPQGAAELYRLLVEETLRRTAPECAEYERWLLFTPSEGRFEFESAWPEETWLDQSGGDLGERMTAAFAQAFGRGAAKVVIVGSDIPRLSRLQVCQALRSLDSHDLVLGPAQDGGYYLIGLTRPHPELFTGVPWSTSAVLPATLERARILGLQVSRLEELTDLDTLEDLRREWPHLQEALATRPDLHRALERALAGSPLREAT